MLPKKEKAPKTNTILDKQNNAVTKDNPAKQRRNRIFVFITLFLTTFLCLSFFLYRKIKSTINSGQPLIPSFRLELPSTAEKQSSFSRLESEIDQIIIKSSGVWSIYGQLDVDQKPPVVWSRNFSSQEAGPLLPIVSAIPFSTTSSIATALPEGLQISEIISQTNGLMATYLIKLPGKQIFVAVKNPDPSTRSVEYLPKIVGAIYWDLVSR